MEIQKKWSLTECEIQQMKDLNFIFAGNTIELIIRQIYI